MDVKYRAGKRPQWETVCCVVVDWRSFKAPTVGPAFEHLRGRITVPLCGTTALRGRAFVNQQQNNTNKEAAMLCEQSKQRSLSAFLCVCVLCCFFSLICAGSVKGLSFHFINMN